MKADALAAKEHCPSRHSFSSGKSEVLPFRLPMRCQTKHRRERHTASKQPKTQKNLAGEGGEAIVLPCKPAKIQFFYYEDNACTCGRWETLIEIF